MWKGVCYQQKNGMENVISEGQSTEIGELGAKKALEKNWCVKRALDFFFFKLKL